MEKSTNFRKSVVLGFAFGDEGKGTAVQWLCGNAVSHSRRPAVVRFSGGAQSSHTVVHEGVTHSFSTYGSGTLLGAPTFLDRDVFFDPVAAAEEAAVLRGKGVDPLPRILSVHRGCRVVTPYDVIAGLADRKVASDGTCGMGIYHTFRRYIDLRGKSAFRYGDHDAMPEYLSMVASYYGMERDAELELKFSKACSDVPAVCSPDGTDSVGRYADEVVYEGSQGLLLDMDCGYWPHVTPSHTGLDNLKGVVESGDADVYLVTRTYLTRHGNGYEPKHPLAWDLSGKNESNVFNLAQGEFKTGMLDFDVLHDAISRHRLDNWQNRYGVRFHLMVTHGDLSVSNGYTDYIWKGHVFRMRTPGVEEVKELFVTHLDEGLCGVKFDTIRVSSTPEGRFE